jgi:Uma2 family endonuclease
MASTTTRLISFEEFEQLPESEARQELHHGELIEVPPPKQGHKRIERRLRRLLEDAGRSSGVVDTEVGFRPCLGNEYWVADVAFVSHDQWEGTPSDGYIVGAPELVIEVLSPSNTLKKMRDRRKICLDNGCREFWIVDSKKREVEVSTPDGHSVTYQAGQQIQLFFAPDGASDAPDGSKIAVNAIFG